MLLFCQENPFEIRVSENCIDPNSEMVEKTGPDAGMVRLGINRNCLLGYLKRVQYINLHVHVLHTLCMRAAKALGRLRQHTGYEPMI